MNRLFKISILILLTAIFLGASFKRNPIIGKWYHSSTENDVLIYAKEPQSIRHSFTFKPNKSTTYSHCTDICGCLRVTNIGTWKQVNDSTIIATYHKRKNRTDPRKNYKLRKPIELKLTIIEANKTKLKLKLERQ